MIIFFAIICKALNPERRSLLEALELYCVKTAPEKASVTNAGMEGCALATIGVSANREPSCFWLEVVFGMLT